jgi:solute carrier family 25 phosphate transporter 3
MVASVGGALFLWWACSQKALVGELLASDPRCEVRDGRTPASKAADHRFLAAPMICAVGMMGVNYLFPDAAVAVVGAGSAGGADWRFFAAGCLAAAISHGVATPVDVVKTRLQTDGDRYGQSIIPAFQSLLREEGVQFMLQGLLPTCVGYGLEGAIKFGSYEFLKPIFASLTPYIKFNFVLAAGVAGGLASIALCPAEEVRIRQVADPGYASSSIGAFVRLVQENGPLASFRGVSVMLSKQVPYTMVKQVTFDLLTSKLYIVLAGVPWVQATGLNVVVPVAAAVPTAMLSCVVSHPGDTLLSAFYKGSSSRGSFASLVGGIVNKDGIGGLLRGLKVRLVHVTVIVTVQLIIYDAVKQVLGLAATGA